MSFRLLQHKKTKIYKEPIKSESESDLESESEPELEPELEKNNCINSKENIEIKNICSLCLDVLENEIFFSCETCVKNDALLFVVCEKCIDNKIDHPHNLTMFSPDNKIIKPIKRKNSPSTQFSNESTPKSLQKENSLNNESNESNVIISPRHAYLKRSSNTSSLSNSPNQSNQFKKSKSRRESINSLFGSIELKIAESNDFFDKKKIKNNDDDDENIVSESEISCMSSPIEISDVNELFFHKDNNETNDKEIFTENLSLKKKNDKKSCKNKLMAKNDSPTFILNKCHENNEMCLCLDEMLENKTQLLYDAIENKIVNHIEILYLDNNNLQVLNSPLFSLIKLKELYLEKNNLRIIPEEIGNLELLTYLNIGSNNLVDLPYNFKNLQNLNTLIADFNDFRQISPMLTELPHLKTLHLRHNPDITNFPPPNILKNFDNLMISIDNNPILMQIWNNYSNITNIHIEWHHTYPDKILQNLYLGCIQTTWNDYVYKYYDINVVYTIGRDLEPMIMDNMEHHVFLVDDIPGAKINFALLNSIHENLKKRKNCLIHCFAGISRSPTVIIAYLMKYHNMDFESAYNHVKSIRDCINPNEGFVHQLLDFDCSLHTESFQLTK